MQKKRAHVLSGRKRHASKSVRACVLAGNARTVQNDYELSKEGPFRRLEHCRFRRLRQSFYVELMKSRPGTAEMERLDQHCSWTSLMAGPHPTQQESKSVKTFYLLYQTRSKALHKLVHINRQKFFSSQPPTLTPIPTEHKSAATQTLRCRPDHPFTKGPGLHAPVPPPPLPSPSGAAAARAQPPSPGARGAVHTRRSGPARSQPDSGLIARAPAHRGLAGTTACAAAAGC
jgi:hypothetical protein